MVERSEEFARLNSQGLASYLLNARSRAAQAAIANKGRGVWSLNHLPGTHFTEFMASALDVSPRWLNRALGRTSVRIFTSFGDGSRAGHIDMQYDAHRGAWAGHLAPILTVGLRDSYDFVNVSFARDDKAHGNVAAVPGALEALWKDAQLVARHMTESAAKPIG